MHSTDRDARVGLVVVGFSPAQRLAALTRHLRWPGLVLSDPQRRLYGALGLGRAPWWRVYTPRTLLIYARARLGGRRLPRAVEDTRQLGGDAIVVDGVVVQLWRPRTPDDRPAGDAVVRSAAKWLDDDKPPRAAPG